MPVELKFLERESILKVLHFFNTAQSDHLQTNNRTEEEFDWLFIKSFLKPALYSVALDSDSGEIIGTYAGIFIPMVSKNGEYILTLKGEDTLLSLDKMIGLEKRDLLKELLETIVKKSKDDKVMFMWGFTPARAAFKRCGFKIITRIRGSFYVTDPSGFYKYQIDKFPQLTLLRKVQLFIFSWFNYLNIKAKFINPGNYYGKKISLDEIDEKMLLSFLPENVYTTYLSKDFLRWRIKENPSPLEYGFLEFRNTEERIVAYFIYSLNEEKVYFVEQFLFARKLRDNDKIQIMNIAFRYCRNQKAIMVRALGLSHNDINLLEMRLLSKSGFYFFNNPEESYFVFQNFTDFDIKPEDVYLSRLNTQGIR